MTTPTACFPSLQLNRHRNCHASETWQCRTGCPESLCVPASEYAVILNDVLMRLLLDDLAVLSCECMNKTANDNAEPTP